MAKREGKVKNGDIKTIADLTPDRRNANRGKPKGGKLINTSLSKVGVGRSVVVDKHGNIIAGNKTIEQAADVFGVDAPVRVIQTDGHEIIVHQRTDLDLEETGKGNNRGREMAYLDNATSFFDLDFDIEAVKADIADGFDFEAIDIGIDELAKMLEGEDVFAGGDGQAGDAEPQIDQAVELAEKWQTKAGQLWAIGEHRLIIGDCTDAGTVARVMGGELSPLVITDPPYGVSYADKNKWLNTIGKANRIETPIENDHASKEDMQKLWREAFSQMNTVMDKGAAVYCFMPQGGDQMMMMMMMMMMGAGIEPRHELIWLKNNHVLGRSDYNYKHEPILYAWKEGGHKFYGGFQTSVIECNKPNKSGLHPTTKPTELIEKLINNSSLVGAIVFDPFAGSGTTGIACQNLGRKARLIEISPNYGAVILERFITAFPAIDIHLVD